MPDTTRDKLRSCMLAMRAVLAQINPRHPLYRQSQELVAEADRLLAAKAGRPGKLDIDLMWRLVADGLSPSEIAAELGVTPSAIRQAKQKRK